MPILLQLFFAFIQVGLFSVGGGYAAIPLIQNQIVDVHHLMTLGEFTDLITIAEMTPGPISINSATFVGTRLSGIPGAILCTLGCIIPSFCICLALITIAEMTPGPISINSATFVGTRLSGIPGAILCTLGCIIPSFCICLALAHFYYKYRNFSGVQTVLSALRPAVVALIASAGLSILMLGLFQSDLSSAVLSNFRPLEAVLFVGGLFLLRKYRYYKYRNFSGVQTVLSALRPAVVALIASAGLSILMLGLFQSDLSSAVLSNFRPLEAVLFVGGLFLLRKYRFNAIAIIFGTGVVGTIAYSLMGAIA